ncbi:MULTISPECIES: cytochrome c family protein [unclassified Ruegeria]|uniref:c-type cytochrome n=1 Tax=unclassified Ruegeria TaxID=2625375 RepID=UPI0020A07CA7|nr:MULTISPECIES: c-type cytochrome [unclassified Ruegeria]
MIEFVFRKAGSAMLTADFDMAEVSGLSIGETTTLDAASVLSLVGSDVSFDTELFVARLSETSVLVSTNDMVFLSAEDAGVNAGVDKLMELANLPSITRTVPITARLIFHSDGKKVAATPAAETAAVAAAASGDIKAGKKVFRKCSACHKLNEGSNAVGPSLHAVIGKPAGQVEGFKYSAPVQNSGIVWTQENLNAFLADPKGFLPGNRMQYRQLVVISAERKLSFTELRP